MSDRLPSNEDKTEQLPSSPRPTSGDGVHGRFSPGDVVADRYRIVSRVGAGGMGEVYRADDTKLGQPVALKFLPLEFARDPDLLARLHSEVRVGRTVSHPNVCRLYDIGEADGHHFIAMEYVAGEDLATLIRRIGRLPHDKAVAVATQLAAGLAAAHAKGILHRDLKPANVMLDQDGDVRITDFGLAAELTGHVEEGILIGTPSYMAPEQLEGKGASIASDLYALGLVLFELFTGRKVIVGKTLHEIVAEHRSGSVVTPSSVVRDIDPMVERIILRCLERDPARRPASAREVLAALPGGDPLAAAVAAGETPSPEMVVDASVEGRLRPVVAWTLLIAGVILAILASEIARQSHLIYRLPLKNPEVIRETALSLTEPFGLQSTGRILSDGYLWNGATIAYLAGGDAKWWKDPVLRSQALEFWWLEIPAGLETRSDDGYLPIGLDYMPPPGSTLVRFDSDGRLLEFRHVTARNGVQSGLKGWSALFVAAGLDPSTAEPIPPQLQPRTMVDQRFAWSARDRDGRKHFVEGGQMGAIPVWFALREPWLQLKSAPPQQPFSGPLFATVVLVVLLALAVLAFTIAWANVRKGRSDLSGTWRLAVVVFLLKASSYLLFADHSTNVLSEVGLIVDAVKASLFVSVTLALFYLGLEPVIRRRWPQPLVSWSRLLAGRWRDPLVGRDVLIGVVGGLTHCVAALLSNRLMNGADNPVSEIVDVMSRLRYDLGLIPAYVVAGVFQGLLAAMLLVLIFIFTRRKVVAITLLYVISVAILLVAFHNTPFAWFWAPMVGLLIVSVVSVAGPLGFASMQTIFLLTFHSPFGFADSWIGHYAAIPAIFVALLLGYGFVTSQGPGALKFPLLEDES
jgi:serine/threonine-protein kinase